MSTIRFFLREFGDGIGYPFCIFDSRETVVYCNNAFERTLGVRDLKGFTLSNSFEATEFSAIAVAVRSCLAGEITDQITIRVEGFPVRYYETIVRTIERKGEVRFAVCTLADVTAKMESLQHAEQAKTFYDRIFNDLPQAFFLIGEDGTILRQNQAAGLMFGYEKLDLPGAPLGALVPAVSAKVSEEERQRIYCGGRIETQGVRKDGSMLTIRMTSFPADLFGLRAYSVIVLDLTEDRERERDMIEEEKKAQGAMRNEALGKLAGKFAHDMNNVLAVIGGFADILAMTSDENTSASVTEILQAVKKGAGLTARILAYTGRQQMESYPVDISRFILSREEQWREILGERIALEVISSAESKVAVADEKLLLQVVFNLLANCREAMPDGGKVEVEIEQEVFDADFFLRKGIRRPPGRFVTLRVRDTGCGIPGDKLPMVFEPYFTTKDPNKSSGLGLAITYGIVKQHAGFIFCESETDKGTEMTVLLPLSDANAAIAGHETEATPQINPADFTVLVADDEEQILHILSAALSSAGFKVITAPNGRIALEKADQSETEIDLLISDVMMPEKSGIELAEDILQIYPGLPIVFVTGYANQIIDKHPVLRHFRVVNKPFSAQEIVSLARAEIGKTVKRDEGVDFSLPE